MVTPSWTNKHGWKVNMFCLICFLVMLQHWWAPARNRGKTTIHPRCWPSPEQDRHLLHRSRQAAHPLPSHKLIECFRLTIQITLRVQPVLWWVPGSSLLFCADHCIQHWCNLHRWVTTCLWVTCQNSEWKLTMFKCFICQSLHFTSQALISHLRLGHSFYPSTKFKLACSQDVCRRQSTTYSGLKKHLNSAHDKDSCQSGDVEMSVISGWFWQFTRYYCGWGNMCHAEPWGRMFWKQWIRSMYRR